MCRSAFSGSRIWSACSGCRGEPSALLREPPEQLPLEPVQLVLQRGIVRLQRLVDRGDRAQTVAADSAAVVSVDPGKNVVLSNGDNRVLITVTAPDETTEKVYTLNLDACTHRRCEPCQPRTVRGESGRICCRPNLLPGHRCVAFAPDNHHRLGGAPGRIGFGRPRSELAEDSPGAAGPVSEEIPVSNIWLLFLYASL